MMHRRDFLKLSATAVAVNLAGMGREAVATKVHPAKPESLERKLPRWRGFNLLEKFTLAGNKPYAEQDFEFMAGWGFDFVRLPMDYRCWGDSDEKVLREVDQAIAWGKQYGIHVNLNFHRAPGYCVNLPASENTLWTDPAAQSEFARHWGLFAKRYQGIPSRQVSFDLVNEPANITGPVYAAVVKQAVDAIRAEDPQRLIIADGLRWGTQPVPELIPFGIAQSTRGYEPMVISHYRASWIPGSDKFPTPQWPVPAGINDHLYGSYKPDLKTPLVLWVACREQTDFKIRINRVSAKADLIVRAGKEIVLQQTLTPGPEADFSAVIPAGTMQIQLEIGEGDWLTFSEIHLGKLVIRPTNHDWAVRQETFVVAPNGYVRPDPAHFQCDKQILQKRMVAPWQELAAKGVGVHVGEWGAYNQTPHAVALAWMTDCLANWKAAGFGWALWNLRGSFGILDSDRKDVKYETFKGHKLDRQMLDLLRRY
jgi:aryl-phospho-beta-D-glucosidase BglC (GH1 family)